jgi:hypothetical protein
VLVIFRLKGGGSDEVKYGHKRRVRLSRGAAPFARLASPANLQRLSSNSSLVFRMAMPHFLSTPVKVTKKAGILYLAEWAPQALPTMDNITG